MFLLTSTLINILKKRKVNILLLEEDKLKLNKRSYKIHKNTKEFRYEKEKEQKITEKTNGITFTSFQTTVLSQASSWV